MLRLRFLKILKFWLFTLVWLGLSSSLPQLQAQPFSWTFSQQDSLDFSGDGRPKRTAGGASRGECQVSRVQDNLTALIPDTSVALTVSAAPTFWFYVPYTLTKNHAAELVIKDSEENFVYHNKFSGKDIDRGITSVSVPDTVELSTDRNYKWYFVIYCDEQNPNTFVYVNGLVKRVANPVSQRQVTQSDREAELSLYTQAKIWHDALDIIATKLKTEPQNQRRQEDWFDILKSVDLEHLADRSIQNSLHFE